MGGCISKHRTSGFRSSGKREDRIYSVNNDEPVSPNSPNMQKSTGFPRVSSDCHSDSVTSIATAEQQLCLSGGTEGTLVLQDLRKGAVTRKWAGHSKEVTRVKFKGNHFLTASRDKSVKIWQKGTENECGTLLGHTLGVTAVDCNEEFTQICSGSRDNSVLLWDVETQTCVMENKLSRNLVTDLCWATQMNFIAQTSEDKALKLWDPRNLQIVHTFAPQGHIQTSCAVSDVYCLTANKGFGNQGCELSLWDIRERKLMKTFRSHTETVSCCTFLQSSPGFISCSHDGTVKLWKPPDSQRALTRSEPQSTVHLNAGTLTSIAVINDNNFLCASFSNGIIPVKTNKNGLSL